MAGLEPYVPADHGPERARADHPAHEGGVFCPHCPSCGKRVTAHFADHVTGGDCECEACGTAYRLAGRLNPAGLPEMKHVWFGGDDERRRFCFMCGAPVTIPDSAFCVGNDDEDFGDSAKIPVRIMWRWDAAGKSGVFEDDPTGDPTGWTGHALEDEGWQLFAYPWREGNYASDVNRSLVLFGHKIPHGHAIFIEKIEPIGVPGVFPIWVDDEQKASP